jgi:hypothetical protein
MLILWHAFMFHELVKFFPLFLFCSVASTSCIIVCTEL